MAEDTAIQWADDTVNFWWGCTKIAPGCKECYAEGISKRFGGDVWGPGKPRLYMPSAAEMVRKLERKAAKEGRPRLVFVNSMSDFFEDHDGPVVDRAGKLMRTCESCGLHGGDGLECTQCGRQTMAHNTRLADLRADAFRLFDQCPHLRFILLTKRPENVRRMWPQKARVEVRELGLPIFRPNVWLLTSISDQPTADALIPPLLQCRDLVPVLGVSAEPLLGPIHLSNYLYGWLNDGIATCATCGFPACCRNRCERTGLDWVIIGGESGPHARPCNLADARSLLDQCREAGVAAYFKQAGSRPYRNIVEIIGPDGKVHYRRPPDHPDVEEAARTPGYKLSSAYEDLDLRDPKGGDLSELPAWCNVRQFPEVNHA